MTSRPSIRRPIRAPHPARPDTLGLPAAATPLALAARSAATVAGLRIDPDGHLSEVFVPLRATTWALAEFTDTRRGPAGLCAHTLDRDLVLWTGEPGEGAYNPVASVVAAMFGQPGRIDGPVVLTGWAPPAPDVTGWAGRPHRGRRGDTARRDRRELRPGRPHRRAGRRARPPRGPHRRAAPAATADAPEDDPDDTGTGEVYDAQRHTVTCEGQLAGLRGLRGDHRPGPRGAPPRRPDHDRDGRLIMTGLEDMTDAAGLDERDPWQAWLRADAEVRVAYAVLGGLYRDAADDPAGFAEVDEHRAEVVLPALETAHAAAQAMIPVLLAEGHRHGRTRLPGPLTRWWRRVTGTDDRLAGPVGDALAEVAACFADSWTARATGGAMSCGEVDALARLLDLGGHRDAAAALLCGHAETDEHGDTHAALAPPLERTDPSPSAGQLDRARRHLPGCTADRRLTA